MESTEDLGVRVRCETGSESGVGVDEKKEVRLLTLPPVVVTYHSVYLVFLMNSLCRELELMLFGCIPFVFQYQVLFLVSSLVSTHNRPTSLISASL